MHSTSLALKAVQGTERKHITRKCNLRLKEELLKAYSMKQYLNGGSVKAGSKTKDTLSVDENYRNVRSSLAPFLVRGHAFLKCLLVCAYLTQSADKPLKIKADEF